MQVYSSYIYIYIYTYVYIYISHIPASKRSRKGATATVSFTTGLLLVYYWCTIAQGRHIHRRHSHRRHSHSLVYYLFTTGGLLLFYYCYTPALLLLYYCFTTALLLLYFTYIPASKRSRKGATATNGAITPPSSAHLYIYKKN